MNRWAKHFADSIRGHSRLQEHIRGREGAGGRVPTRPSLFGVGPSRLFRGKKKEGIGVHVEKEKIRKGGGAVKTAM